MGSLRIDQLTPVTTSTPADIIPVVPVNTVVAQNMTLGQLQAFVLANYFTSALPSLPYFASDAAAASALPAGSLYRITGSKVVSQV